MPRKLVNTRAPIHTLMRTVGVRAIGAAPAPDIIMKYGSHSLSAALPSFALDTRQKVVSAKTRKTLSIITVG